MTRHACVLGIDGSGKSSTSRALIVALARRGLHVVGAGDAFVESLPGGLTVSNVTDKHWVASAALSFRAAAKRLHGAGPLYAAFKLGHVLLQDSAAYRLGLRLGADVVVSDGNLLLNAVGRAGNHRRAASRGLDGSAPRPSIDDLASLYRLLCEGVPLTRSARATLPPVSVLGPLFKGLRAIGLRPARLPDVAIFLDVSPELALSRIRLRGEHVDAHENAADLAQAREGYLRAIEALRVVRGDAAAVVIACDGLAFDEVVERAEQALSRPK